MFRDMRNIQSAPCSPIKPFFCHHGDLKVPVGDTPYVKAKRVQLVEKDPGRAIPLFWAAINAGDRVDSALKDLAIVMKQQNRPEEAIEAIRSFRDRCSNQAQESLDNILLELYKGCGRLDDQIALLMHKLRLIEHGYAFNGRRTKMGRSQGKKFVVSVEHEVIRLLGNLGWALMQKESYIEAEAAYRRALMVGGIDNNKLCNLGICLMKQGRIGEARDVLYQVCWPVANGADSHIKAYERAQEMLRDIEAKMLQWHHQFNQNWQFQAFFGNSSIWQPLPCVDYARSLKDQVSSCNMKRMRTENVEEMGKRKRSEDARNEEWMNLPDDDEFSKAMVASVIASFLDDDSNGSCSKLPEKKKLKIFEDITPLY